MKKSPYRERLSLMPRATLGLFIVLSLAGCGTIGDVTHSRGLYATRTGQKPARIYGGIRTDVALISSDMTPGYLVPVAVLDIPFSFVVDTVLLPVTVALAIVRDTPANGDESEPPFTPGVSISDADGFLEDVTQSIPYRYGDAVRLLYSDADPTLAIDNHDQQTLHDALVHRFAKLNEILRLHMSDMFVETLTDSDVDEEERNAVRTLLGKIENPFEILVDFAPFPNAYADCYAKPPELTITLGLLRRAYADAAKTQYDSPETWQGFIEELRRLKTETILSEPRKALHLFFSLQKVEQEFNALAVFILLHEAVHFWFGECEVSLSQEIQADAIASMFLVIVSLAEGGKFLQNPTWIALGDQLDFGDVKPILVRRPHEIVASIYGDVGFSDVQKGSNAYPPLPERLAGIDNHNRYGLSRLVKAFEDILNERLNEALHR